MLENLTSISFAPFGRVLKSSIAASAERLGYSIIKTREVTHGRFNKLFCNPHKKTVLDIYDGTAILFIGTSQKELKTFLLDKVIEINEGIYYYVIPLVKRATISIAEGDGTIKTEIDSITKPPNILPVIEPKEIYTFFYHEKEKGFFFSGESHPVLELTYVGQGVMHSVTDGQELVLEQGDMVLYGPNQWHMQYADMEVAPRYVTISFEVQDGKLESLLNRKLHPTQAGVTLIQQMIREQDRMDAYSMDMIATQLTQLLLLLLRHQEPVTKLMASNALNSENEIICRAQQYISAHIREKLSVPLVAKMVDVSPSYMTALFHKNLQISPGEYIRRVKIQESKQMIREGNMNFTQIAATLHYSTVHHFSRQFKDKVGFTPTEYAKSVR